MESAQALKQEHTSKITDTKTKGCYAIIAELAANGQHLTGNVKEIVAKTKTELAKEMQVYGSSWTLLAAFKGKKLSVDKKISLIFK